MELVEEVSRNLRPSPTTRTAADAILANLTASGGAFNGVHLRLEDDAPYKEYAGGEQVCGARALNPLPPLRLLGMPVTPVASKNVSPPLQTDCASLIHSNGHLPST
jgi:hypothetical protein